jgi:hypothetical protein
MWGAVRRTTYERRRPVSGDDGRAPAFAVPVMASPSTTRSTVEGERYSASP